MIVPDFFFSLMIALCLSLLFARIIRSRGSRYGFFWFFLLIFLATWAGGIWIRPFGPDLWGVNWLSFLVVGLIFAILATLSALRRTPEETFRQVKKGEQLSRGRTMDLLDDIGQEREARQLTYVTMGIFFWIVLLSLLLAIVLRYALKP